jgi:hypothetical protein
MRNPKEEAIDLIGRLPDNITTPDIIEELFFKWQIDECLQDALEGRTISHEELKERLALWRQSVGR